MEGRHENMSRQQKLKVFNTVPCASTPTNRSFARTSLLSSSFVYQLLIGLIRYSSTSIKQQGSNVNSFLDRAGINCKSRKVVHTRSNKSFESDQLRHNGCGMLYDMMILFSFILKMSYQPSHGCYRKSDCSKYVQHRHPKWSGSY